MTGTARALRDICEQVSSGGTPSRKNRGFFASEGGHLWVKSQELNDGFIWETGEHISDAGLAASSAKYYPPHTVLVAMYGATVGKLAILRAAATVNQAICALRVDPTVADYLYVFYALLETRGALTAQAAGAAQQNLNQDLIRNFEIPLPPLETQRKIAGVLSVYDDLIENNTRRLQILEEMTQAIYREWFVEFRFPGHEDVPMVDSELGRIPEGWQVQSVTDLADVLSGGTPGTGNPDFWDGDIPFFTPRDAPDTLVLLETEKRLTRSGLENCNSQLYPAGTVFITARGTVGKVVMPAVPMAMNQSCYAIRGRDGLSHEFILLMLWSQADYLKVNTGGATFDTIVVDTFRRMRVLRPPAHSVAAFTVVVQPLLELETRLLEANRNLRRIRDFLLPRLISGEVDVTGLDIDTAGLVS